MNNLVLLMALLFTLAACDSASTADTDQNTTTTLSSKEATLLEFDLPNHYPEGIEYRQKTKTIYLGSMSGQPITTIAEDGTITPFSKGDPFPLATIGIEIDEQNNRLIACCSDRNKEYDRPISNVRVYDLESGKLLQDLNLAELIQAENYQANDATVCANGAIVLSDRKGNALYHIDKDYQTTVFYQNAATLKMPNGLTYHPDNFVLVTQYMDHPQLCKFPYAAPEEMQEVIIEDDRFAGFDGLVLVNKNTIVGVTTAKNDKDRDALLELTTTDNWASASVSNYQKIKPSTTVAIAGPNDYYVLNQDFKQPTAKTVVIERVQF